MVKTMGLLKELKKHLVFGNRTVRGIIGKSADLQNYLNINISLIMYETCNSVAALHQ